MFNSATAVSRLVFRLGAPLLNVEDVVLGILPHVLFGKGDNAAANRVSCYERNLQVVDVNHEKGMFTPSWMCFTYSTRQRWSEVIVDFLRDFRRTCNNF